MLAARPHRSATCRAAARSQAWPAASSNRWLNGALLDSCGTFSTRMVQSVQQTRYTSTTTVVRNSMQGRSRTSPSGVVGLFQFPTTSRTHQLSIAALPAHPELQSPGLLIDLM